MLPGLGGYCWCWRSFSSFPKMLAVNPAALPSCYLFSSSVGWGGGGGGSTTLLLYNCAYSYSFCPSIVSLSSSTLFGCNLRGSPLTLALILTTISPSTYWTSIYEQSTAKYVFIYYSLTNKDNLIELACANKWKYLNQLLSSSSYISGWLPPEDLLRQYSSTKLGGKFM